MTCLLCEHSAYMISNMGLSSYAKVVDFPAVPFLFLFHLAIATVGLLEMSQVALLGKLKGKGCWWRQ